MRAAIVSVFLGVILAIYGHAEKIELSSEPRIYMLENFLSDEECDHLIAHARPHLKRSVVVSEHTEVVSGGRTSLGMFFYRKADPVITGIEERIAELMLLPIENGEGLQVLNYGVGAEYRPHHDYFDRETPGGIACLKRGGQRIATLIMYLANTEEGGETIFPIAEIKVKPVKGNAVLFYNCTPDGQEDPQTLHGGAPVIRGEKWIATKWLHPIEFR
jgi:prolyl 4-hydroxylase